MEEHRPARRFSPPTLEAGVEPPVTTARGLAAYREELAAVGFTPEHVRELVNIAARNDQRGLLVDQAFVERTAPVIPFTPTLDVAQDAR